MIEATSCGGVVIHGILVFGWYGTDKPYNAD